MCGIAGILRIHPPGSIVPLPEDAIPESWLDTLDESIKHRGPDGQGRFRDRATRPDGTTVDVAFVHRRLSILDHAGGAQPMVYSQDNPFSAIAPEDSSDLTAVIFNGCIYNHRAIRRRLESAGQPFQTDHSDTETLLHAWRHWKAQAFDLLDGMIACAIWDRQTATAHLFRSSPGERPLYRAQSSDGIFAFASTAAALVKLGQLVPWINTHRDTNTLTRWITFGYLSDLTPIPGIDQLPFGCLSNVGSPPEPDPHTGFVEGDNFQGGDIPRAKAITASRADQLLQAVDSLIAETVAARIQADVPVGCLLSGGVDSSLVAFHAAKHTRRLTTVCVRMPFPDFDESSFAEIVAKQIGSFHHTIDTSPRPAEDLIALIHAMGLPFGDSSLLPTYWACTAARKEVGVALTGDGGDELFYGYDRYLAANAAMKHADSFNLFPLFLLNRSNPKGRGDKLARFIIATRQHSALSLGAIFQEPDLAALVGKAAAKQVGWDYNLGADQLRRCELRFSLQGDMLRKVDTAALMAHLEVRAPLLDQTLVFAMQSLSERELMPRGQRKGFLRAIARKYLPTEIVDRPKQGFAIPIGEWFRTDYGGMKQLLLDHLNSTDPWGSASLGIHLNMKFIRQMLDEHMGTGMSGRVKRDHSQRLYMLLVLSIWARWMGKL